MSGERLFQTGDFLLHSGLQSRWKIDCDALTVSDIETLAMMCMERVPAFGAVEGVPRGGCRLAEALRPFVTTGPVLIVDDVFTTGRSLEQHRAGREAMGVVIFARAPVPAWISVVFQMAPSTALVEPREPEPPTLRQALTDCLDVIEPLRDELRKQGRDDAAMCCHEVIAYSRSALAAVSTAHSQRIEDLQRIRDEQEQIMTRCLSGCDPRYAPALAMLAAIDEVLALLTPEAP